MWLGEFSLSEEGSMTDDTLHCIWLMENFLGYAKDRRGLGLAD